MKNLRAIIFILTAVFALSACESPTDVASRQNVNLVGTAPIKSVSVEVEKAVNQTVNELRGAAVKSTFNPQSSFVDINSNPALLSLSLSAESPVPDQQGIFLRRFDISFQNIIADGREYQITSGINQSNTGAQFNTVSQFATSQGWQNTDYTIPTSQSKIMVRFDHQPGEKTMTGNLTAYMAKDTVIRIPIDAVSTAEAEAMFKQYEIMGFEIKNEVPQVDTVNSEIIFPATQIFLNMRSKITVQY